VKPAAVQDAKDGTILTVHIQPNASRTEVAGLHGEALKIRVAAPPVDGAANAELIRFLARELSIPQRSLFIQSGASGRAKRVLLKTLSAAQVMAHFNVRR
jgi:uncharacterized protein